MKAIVDLESSFENSRLNYSIFRLTLSGVLKMNGRAFANAWEKGWNSHDLDLIMSHYCDDVVFRSRKAIPLVGQGEIHGKQALRNYWKLALERQPELRFQVQNVLEGHQMLVITYLNHREVLAAEVFYFDDNGMVFQAGASHEIAEK